jgi:dTDP-4-amino-4,6-dideoxygalactose transaminase
VVARVPLADLAAQEATVLSRIQAAVERVARSGQFILGPEVAAFESWLAQFVGTAHAVGVASGTDALVLTLRALGIGAGDAVVTPALSFIAAAEAIAAVGACPVFCDVDPATMNASEATVDAALRSADREGLRVRAILPVHLFGRCAPRGLADVARRAGAALIEDAAQALGAKDDQGAPAGSFGDASCFSFFPSKNLGAWGDGGAIVTSREDVARSVRRLRAHGAVSPYVHAEIGCNSRLDALQAAILMAKVPELERWQNARAARAARYREGLLDLDLVLPEDAPPPGVHAWHAYVVRSGHRDALARWLGERGIDARVYYPVPLHRQACFASLPARCLVAAENACCTALALPIFTMMTDAQQDLVIDETRRFFESGGPRALPRR